MTRYLSIAGTALVLMAILDALWIGVIASKFYRQQLGSLYSTHVVWPAAVLFYLIYIAGLTYFVLAPAIGLHSFWRVIFSAAFFALVAFGTYDLTSLSITTGWPVLMTVVDMTWGVFEGIIIAAGTYFIATRFFHF